MESEIAYASKNNILYTVADCIDELIKIKEIDPNMKIFWRVNVKEEEKEHLMIFSNKFGDDISNNDEETLNKFAYIKHHLGIDLYGVCFHCGSSQQGSQYFTKGIQIARKTIEIAKKVGHPIEILDIGGGFPAYELSDKLVQELSILNDDSLGFKVIAEPGRHFSSQCCYLFTRVLVKKYREGKICIHCNESIFHSFNDKIYEYGNIFIKNQFYSYVHNTTLETKEIFLEQCAEGSIFGMTCAGCDVLLQDSLIPLNIQTGDWICFGGMGAYSFVLSSHFNGMISTQNVFEEKLDIIQKQKIK